MATVTTTVKSSGGDYTGIVAWNAGEQTNLVNDGNIHHCECYAFQDTISGDGAISGWTTGASNYIRIYAPDAERHDGTWGNGYRVYSTSGGAATFYIDSTNYLYIDGISMLITQANSYPIYEVAGGTGVFQLSRSRIEKSGGSSTQEVLLDGNANCAVKIWNCIIVNSGSVGGDGITISLNNRVVDVYNTTIINNSIGINNSGTLTLKNVLFDDNTTDVSGSVTDTYCATDNNNTKGLSSGGAGNRFSQTFTFVGSGDYHLTVDDTGAKDYGVSDPGSGLFSDDIDGVVRTGAWDIGADEYPAAAGAAWIPRVIFIG